MWPSTVTRTYSRRDVESERMCADKPGTVLDFGGPFGAGSDDEVDSFEHLVRCHRMGPRVADWFCWAVADSATTFSIVWTEFDIRSASEDNDILGRLPSRLRLVSRKRGWSCGGGRSFALHAPRNDQREIFRTQYRLVGTWGSHVCTRPFLPAIHLTP